MHLLLRCLTGWPRISRRWINSRTAADRTSIVSAHEEIEQWTRKRIRDRSPKTMADLMLMGLVDIEWFALADAIESKYKPMKSFDNYTYKQGSMIGGLTPNPFHQVVQREQCN